MIVLAANEKGGTGKTILAVNLAVMRLLAGRRVLLIDTDRQGSASTWSAVRDQSQVDVDLPVRQVFGAELRTALVEWAGEYEDVIIDAGGRDSLEMRAGLLAADLVVIPFRPSQFDVWSLDRMVELIHEGRKVNPSLRALAVINLASTHPGVQEAEEAREFLTEYKKLNLAETVIRDRIIFRKATREGLAVVEMKPVDPKAVSEMQGLYGEVFGA